MRQLLASRGIPNEFHIYPGRHDPLVIRHFGEVMQFQWKAIGAGEVANPTVSGRLGGVVLPLEGLPTKSARNSQITL